MPSAYKRAGWQTQIKVNIYSLIPSVCIFLFFASILLSSQTNSSIVSALYYAVILLVFLFSLIFCRKSSMFVIICAVISTIIGIVNHYYIGNIALLRLFIISSSFFVSLWFIREDPYESSLLLSYILNVIIILFHFAKDGIQGNVYISSSNNYVSIYLLAPLVLYYTICERHQKRINIIPSLIAFVISFFSGSRGGFLACAILFVGIITYRYFHGKRNKLAKVLLIASFILIAILLIDSLIPLVTNKFGGLRVVTNFTSMGFGGNGRMEIWEEYLNSLKQNNNIILGSKLSTLYYMRVYDLNLHNSFLFVHAYFGILGITFVFSLLGYGVFTSIKQKKWIYLLCLITFIFRAMTDHMFGGHRLTPVFLFLLMYPIIINQQNKKNLGGFENVLL